MRGQIIIKWRGEIHAESWGRAVASKLRTSKQASYQPLGFALISFSAYIPISFSEVIGKRAWCLASYIGEEGLYLPRTSRALSISSGAGLSIGATRAVLISKSRAVGFLSRSPFIEVREHIGWLPPPLYRRWALQSYTLQIIRTLIRRCSYNPSHKVRLPCGANNHSIYPMLLAV